SRPDDSGPRPPRVQEIQWRRFFQRDPHRRGVDDVYVVDQLQRGQLRVRLVVDQPVLDCVAVERGAVLEPQARTKMERDRLAVTADVPLLDEARLQVPARV